MTETQFEELFVNVCSCVCVCGVCVYGSICSYLGLHPLLGTGDVSGDVIVFVSSMNDGADGCIVCG